MRYYYYINVKVYRTAHAIKYIYKYLFKGVDYVTLTINYLDNKCA